MSHVCKPDTHDRNREKTGLAVYRFGGREYPQHGGKACILAQIIRYQSSANRETEDVATDCTQHTARCDDC